ncbi:MAG TPA: hypothetical protein VM470_02900, partial [Acidimicrobiia bacterium]|nr:hypothetical protein [Acidimicrobiia bacterium]
MRRETLGYQDPEIIVESQIPAPEVGKPPSSRTPWSVAGAVIVGLAVAVSLGQGEEQAEPEPVPTAELPLPAPATTVTTTSTGPLAAFELSGSFDWLEVRGLNSFESITAPVPYGEGHIVVGNPPGIGASAAVMFSQDGSRWERLGTVRGTGGEVEIIDLEVFQGQLLALGTITETMPRGEAEPRHRLGAVWTSKDGITWEMTRLGETPDRLFTPQTLVAGKAAVMVTGWSDSDYGEVARFAVLPDVY